MVFTKVWISEDGSIVVGLEDDYYRKIPERDFITNRARNRL